jgi:hypothetical protein
MGNFPRILALTTPKMRDANVNPDTGVAYGDISRAQKLLGHNKFSLFYKGLDEDGVYGNHTAAATRRAMWMLGYPKRLCKKRFTQGLADRLSGDHKLAPLYRVRRKKRLMAKKPNLGKDALAAMKKRNGEHENPPGSNKCPVTKKWGFVGAWCLMTVSLAYLEAKSKVFKLGSMFAYNPTFYAFVHSGHSGVEFIPLAHAEPGDIVQLNEHVDSDPPDHACLFVKLEGNNVHTLDGNWGDKVGYQVHAKSSVMDVIRVTE